MNNSRRPSNLFTLASLLVGRFVLGSNFFFSSIVYVADNKNGRTCVKSRSEHEQWLEGIIWFCECYGRKVLELYNSVKMEAVKHFNNEVRKLIRVHISRSCLAWQAQNQTVFALEFDCVYVCVFVSPARAAPRWISPTSDAQAQRHVPGFGRVCMKLNEWDQTANACAGQLLLDVVVLLVVKWLIEVLFFFWSAHFSSPPPPSPASDPIEPNRIA